MKRHIFTSIFITLSFVLDTSAHSAIHRPSTCPQAAKIIAAGLKEVDQLGEADSSAGAYLVYNIDHYSTHRTWIYGITLPMNEASSHEDALNKARTLIQSVSGQPTPVEQGGDYVCTYQIKGDYANDASLLEDDSNDYEFDDDK